MSSFASRRLRESLVLALAIGLVSSGCALQHRATDAVRGDTNPVDSMVVEGGDTRVEAGDSGPMDGDAVDAPIEEDTGGCPGTRTLCGAACFDLQTDPMNCGACNMACAAVAHAQSLCSNGTCAFTCDAGFGDCDGNASNGCEAPLNDGTNCGACHNACTAMLPVCSAGTGGTFTCSSGCTGAEMLCGGTACVDLQTSVSNCGTCGTICTTTNGTPGCASGRCTVASCDPGRGDCDGTVGNGCEVNTNTSLMNCGGCGRSCSAAANAMAACSGGTCGLTCNGTFRNCDGNNSNGCEIQTATDTTNCGACGNRCNLPNATAGCMTGACTVASCATGFGNCDATASNGCETNFNTNPMHCGNCMTVCSAGTACMSGTCRPFASCNEIHAMRPALTSGMYMIDPDGPGGTAPINVFCDMATGPGGWTVIFDPNTMTDYNVANLDYTVTNDTLRMNSTEVLLAFRGSMGAVVGTTARFAIPADWVTQSPFRYVNVDLTTDVTIGGSTVSGATLRYGNHDYGTDCASNWDPASSHDFGRVCIVGTMAPFYAGFNNSSGDYCQDSSQMRDTTTCAAGQRFTIAVR